jgi:hypothetical protein
MAFSAGPNAQGNLEGSTYNYNPHQGEDIPYPPQVIIDDPDTDCDYYNFLFSQEQLLINQSDVNYQAYPIGLNSSNSNEFTTSLILSAGLQPPDSNQAVPCGGHAGVGPQGYGLPVPNVPINPSIPDFNILPS